MAVEIISLEEDAAEFERPAIPPHIARISAEIREPASRRNAERVIRAIPEDKEILFLPDMFLGTYLEKVTGRKMHVWPGECHVHAGIRPQDIDRARAEHGDADLLVHPECGCASQCMYFKASGDIDAERTHILSTEGMVRHAQQHPARTFVVATELGIMHRLAKI